MRFIDYKKNNVMEAERKLQKYFQLLFILTFFVVSLLIVWCFR